MVRTVNSDCWQHLGSSCRERLEMPEESATQSTKINISLETCLNFYRCEQSTMTLVINISSKIVSEFSDVTHSNTKVRYLDGTPNKHSFLLSRKLFFCKILFTNLTTELIDITFCICWMPATLCHLISNLKFSSWSKITSQQSLYMIIHILKYTM